MDTDVIVIGAGLAGLQAARRLEEEGLGVLVLEREQEIGGRVRTDHIDGFLLDRGFQVLNPAYRAVRDWVDLKALGMQHFDVGVQLRDDTGISTLAHPLRHPRLIPQTLRSGYLSPVELFALARWLGPTLVSESISSRATRDTTLTAALDRAGITGPLRRNVLDTFLAGVLADGHGTTSANLARLLLRSFAYGSPGLPRGGMQALPQQLVDRLQRAPLTGHAVTGISETGEGVTVDTDAGSFTARYVVVATDPVGAGELTGVEAPRMKGLATWWFRTDEAPDTGKFIRLDATRPGGGAAGPVLHAAVVSAAAPSYAPAGQHLIEATALLGEGSATEAEVRADLERIYATSTGDWELIIRHDVPHSLPEQRPPLVDRQSQRVGEHIFVAGDHRDTASINGALISGDRAARAISGLIRA
ncbi:flavin monoamine oxidase family protein [Corynebacterium gallinarum]|uniref:FAD-dependent oxidoreductase n=1 Tax=Corynebacterium gallinarum TaxID=2762214 RepID=A0A8I0LBH4_9CORY|nr:FAD-dependent oxidoreductase [Corynebacterium gallinarum]MBD8030872.1 FAD-dependent oxidoreductase [Corynebacterium gallinarum]